MEFSLIEDLYDSIITNMSKLDDNNRYYNWYYGYTEIKLPYKVSEFVKYEVNTAALSGTISTQHFGDMFDSAKVETDLAYQINVFPPMSAFDNPNVTLHFNIERISMKDIIHGIDDLDVYKEPGLTNPVDTPHFSQNYTPPAANDQCCPSIYFTRNAHLSDIKVQKLKLMPGFRLSWYYSGMDGKAASLFHKNSFIRNGYTKM